MNGILDDIRQRVLDADLLIGRHARQALTAHGFTTDDLLYVIDTAQFLEDHPEDARGHSCLLSGVTETGRHMHICCTVGRSPLFIITVYQPKPPRWVSPTQRR